MRKDCNDNVCPRSDKDTWLAQSFARNYPRAVMHRSDEVLLSMATCQQRNRVKTYQTT